jgi:DUF4097 and DUF4098 domain-containing protein YvlB
MPVFDTPGSVSLQVRIPSGRVRVTTAHEPQTSVELISSRRGQDALDDVAISADERQGRHVITIEQKDRFRWGPIQITWGGDLEVRITCPPGSDLELAGGSTDLKVDGDLGAVSAKTASGDVRLGNVRDKVEVKTASGDVSIGTIARGGAVVTVSGDMEIRRIDGELAARSVSGDVEIGALAAPLTLATTSGDVTVAALEAGEFRVQTVSGDARIGVARGTRVWIDAVSVSGDLKSELGLADQVPEGEGEENEASPVVPLHVKTVSGDVRIVRSAEAGVRL